MWLFLSWQSDTKAYEQSLCLRCLCVMVRFCLSLVDMSASVCDFAGCVSVPMCRRFCLCLDRCACVCVCFVGLLSVCITVCVRAHPSHEFTSRHPQESIVNVCGPSKPAQTNGCMAHISCMRQAHTGACSQRGPPMDTSCCRLHPAPLYDAMGAQNVNIHYTFLNTGPTYYKGPPMDKSRSCLHPIPLYDSMGAQNACICYTLAHRTKIS